MAVEGGGYRELRIHGVGGSPGAALLGLSDREDTVVVGEGRGTVFLARRADRSVEGYDWGGLTSSSPWQPLWLLLLPFTLLNVAGWMHPPRDGRRGRDLQIRAIRALVHVLAATLTASFTLWVALVAVDLLGVQWSRRAGATPGAQGLGFWTGILVTVLVLAALHLVSERTRQRFEGVRPDGSASPPRRWAADEDLSRPTFFDHARSADRWIAAHGLVVLVTVVLVALVGRAPAAAGDPLPTGRLFVLLGGLQFGLLAVLAAVSWPGAPGRRPRAMAAVAATLSVALTNGFFSGAVLAIGKALEVAPGQELALTDVFVVTLGLFAAGLLGFLWWHVRRADAADLPAGPGHAPAEEYRGVTPAIRAATRRARGLAAASHRSPLLLAWTALAFWLLGTGFGLRRLRTGGSPYPWEWQLAAPDPDVPLFLVAAWLLPALLGGVAYFARRSATTVRIRRTVGIVWDVLTFWPRRFHPLAVRPYSERAVPEFQARVRGHATQGRAVLVSAHSQGSVIAFAALAPLPAEVLGRVALLTFGSPIATLYAPIFPAYLGPPAVAAVAARSRAWRNLHRRTDPIGGPVFPGVGSAQADDREVEDPATGPQSWQVPEGPTPWEPLRPPWIELAGHARFPHEVAFKDTVEELRALLAAGQTTMSRTSTLPRVAWE